MDGTEPFRRHAINIINSEVESQDKDSERTRLEALHGKVYSTDELSTEFVVESFMAPYIVCTNKQTKERGTMEFQDRPRFYFNFRPA